MLILEYDKKLRSVLGYWRDISVEKCIIINETGMINVQE